MDQSHIGEKLREKSDLAVNISHSGLMQTRYTCTTNLTIDKAYPQVAEHRDRKWRLDLPAGARWLFYGPSYLGQVFSTFVAANSGRITSIENLEDSDLLREYPPDARKEASCVGYPDYCNDVTTRQKCNATVAFGVQRVTLDNGAVLVGIHNNGLLQTAAQPNARYLSKLLRHLKIDHVFYQHPHDFETYEGPPNAGCTEMSRLSIAPRSRNATAVDNNQMNQTSQTSANMCFSVDTLHTTADQHLACVARSVLWDAVRANTRTATIVAPAPVGPASNGHVRSKAIDNDRIGSRWKGARIYYTRHRVEHFRCAVMWDLAAGLDGLGYTLPPTSPEGWFLLGHQCVVLTDGHGEYLGGPVMAIAEDLLELAKREKVRTRAWGMVQVMPGFV